MHNLLGNRFILISGAFSTLEKGVESRDPNGLILTHWMKKKNVAALASNLATNSKTLSNIIAVTPKNNFVPIIIHHDLVVLVYTQGTGDIYT